MTAALRSLAGVEALETYKRMPDTLNWLLEEVRMPQVIIRHKDGREYEIDSADFRRGKHVADPKSGDMVTYEAAGFEIVSLADGSAWTPPSERHAPPKEGD